MKRSRERWYVYVVECADGSLYTGIAKDVDRRVAMHNEGKGAKYTRGRGPVRMRAASAPLTLGRALQLEARVKRMRGEEKLVVLERAAQSRPPRKSARVPSAE